MNLRDYIAWRGDLTFDMIPFNHVDAAIFSQLSMLQLDDVLVNNKKMTIKEIVASFDDNIRNKNYNLGIIIPTDIIMAFEEMAKSKRYQDLVLGNYVNLISKDEETQFSALTIDIDNHTRVVSFSGTDDTIIGWKENFNMVFVDATSSQHLSCAYLEKVCKKSRHLYVVGHSKGANLTLYSALHSSPRIQRRLVEAIGFDGPGITEDIELIANFDKIIEKVIFYVPEDSIIGTLFDHYETAKIVKSNKKGLFQHDLFSWEVTYNDFIYANQRTKESMHIEKKIKQMISNMDEHTKHTFVNEMYNVLTNSKNETLTDISKDKLQIAKRFLSVETEKRAMLVKVLKELTSDKIIREAVFNDIVQYSKNKTAKAKELKGNKKNN